MGIGPISETTILYVLKSWKRHGKITKTGVRIAHCVGCLDL